MFRQLVTKSVSGASRPVFSAARVAAIQTRAFHSPFAVLAGSKTPAESASKPSAAAQYELAQAYEKQHVDVSAEPNGLKGARTYVVSDPDPAHAPFGVKSGAYSVSEPFSH